MFNVRQIDLPMLQENGSLILLTSRDIAEDSPLYVADFRDIQALVYVPTGNWLGTDGSGIRLGKGPLEMIDGVWYMEEDLVMKEKHHNIQLSPELLSFGVID